MTSVFFIFINLKIGQKCQSLPSKFVGFQKHAFWNQIMKKNYFLRIIHNNVVFKTKKIVHRILPNLISYCIVHHLKFCSHMNII